MAQSAIIRFMSIYNSTTPLLHFLFFIKHNLCIFENISFVYDSSLYLINLKRREMKSRKRKLPKES